jgi:cholesterol transport system auxiliary component
VSRYGLAGIARSPVVFLLLALTVAGCTLTGRSTVPAPRVFLLTDVSAELEPRTAEPRSGQTLRIAAARSAPGFNTRRMAYVRPGEGLRYFAWHEWADTPAQLLASLAEQRLDGTNRFASVISGAPEVSTDLRLELSQVSLLQTVLGAKSSVALSAKATLVDSRERRVLGSCRLTISEEAAADPAAGAAAADRAASRLLDALTEFLAVVGGGDEYFCEGR